MKRLKQKQGGFTIIELMIAISVLSTMLVLVTVMMINIGKLYYKGINQARVQDSVRAVSDEVSQQIQSSGTKPEKKFSLDGGTSVWCVGNTRYVYVLEKQIAGHVQHVLWRDKEPGCPVPANNFLSNPHTDGAELVPANSRLTAFSIDGTSPYVVTVGIAYGEPNPSATPSPDDLFTGSGVDTRCTGGPGSQFCATASLTTIVTRRLKTN